MGCDRIKTFSEIKTIFFLLFTIIWIVEVEMNVFPCFYFEWKWKEKKRNQKKICLVSRIFLSFFLFLSLPLFYSLYSIFSTPTLSLFFASTSSLFVYFYTPAILRQHTPARAVFSPLKMPRTAISQNITEATADEKEQQN